LEGRSTLPQRGAKAAEVHNRIVEATVELHRTVGPAETTFSAVAALARVQRHTLYSHFPNQGELFKACGAHSSPRTRRPVLPPGWKCLNPVLASVMA
jgi:AcrR family transcriptional regulator